jgi:hypothetical protein
MPISGNPKSLAMDIADGFVSLSPSTLRRYTPSDLKIIHSNLNLVLREVRGEVIPPEDLMGIKKKNLRIQRINQALLMLSNYCRTQKVPL